MIRFLGWGRSIVMSVVNGIARAVVALVLLSLLVASGHIKASELRQWVVEKILSF